MELTPEYIKAVRFTVKRGNTYDAAEVDAFLDELLEAVTALQNRSDADTLAAVCTIRAEMTEQITRAVLEAEKRIAPLLSDENAV
ncbi:MAG: DivIVA domain-containing protein [Oscillospiraceae bacterium]|mgnify:FL=1|nr:DivIVA domain-containing protein [Oscillospiraceae bacterium]